MKIINYPYQTHPLCYFESIADLPDPILLDSQGKGRFDIIVAAPYQVGDQLDVLSKELAAKIETQITEEIPFIGGVIGYMTYDYGLGLNQVQKKDKPPHELPLLKIGFYDWAFVIDHEKKAAFLVSLFHQSETQLLWQNLKERFDSASKTEQKKPNVIVKNLNTNLPFKDYAKKFDTIKSHLYEGNCYQVNLTQQFEMDTQSDSWALYQAIRYENPAPFSAYIAGKADILSFSPERFLRLDYPMIETKPIKGTRPRGHDGVQDRELAKELKQSEKDRAENLMIVDLMRNDLGRLCKPGSIKVPKLFEIESYPAVHHLVSTIIGELEEGGHPEKLLQTCFPGGSITGAPKIAAMKIIEDLEPHRRSIYCGSIFYIDYRWNMDSSICIRTLVKNNHKLYCWAGGGIVHDSEVDAEYQECFDKIAKITQPLIKSTD